CPSIGLVPSRNWSNWPTYYHLPSGERRRETHRKRLAGFLSALGPFLGCCGLRQAKGQVELRVCNNLPLGLGRCSVGQQHPHYRVLSGCWLRALWLVQMSRDLPLICLGPSGLHPGREEQLPLCRAPPWIIRSLQPCSPSSGSRHWR